MQCAHIWSSSLLFSEASCTPFASSIIADYFDQVRNYNSQPHSAIGTHTYTQTHTLYQNWLLVTTSIL